MSFSFSPEKLEALTRSISPCRLAPYQEQTDGDESAAFGLYELNSRLSQSLYVPLQALEVCVRNDMDRALVGRFGEQWIEGEGVILQPRQFQDIAAAVSEVSTDNRGRDIDYVRGDVVAELNFGFWVGLLGPKNENEVWRKALYLAFSNRPKGTERAAVQGALNSIRRLRNRIAHHRRIIHRDLAADYETILEIIGWVCPHTLDWTLHNSTFNKGDIPTEEAVLPLEPAPKQESEKAAPKPTRGGRARLSIGPKSR